MQLCRKHQGEPLSTTAHSSSTPWSSLHPADSLCGFWFYEMLGGGAERGKWSVLPHAKCKLLPWLKTSPNCFSLVCVTLQPFARMEVGASQGCWLPGAASHTAPLMPGPFGKLQFGLTQHRHKTSACPVLQAKPYLLLFVASEHTNQDVLIIPRGKVHYRPSISSQASGDAACIVEGSSTTLLWLNRTGFPGSTESCWFEPSIYF